jgi:hypothetical protein
MKILRKDMTTNVVRVVETLRRGGPRAAFQRLLELVDREVAERPDGRRVTCGGHVYRGTAWAAVVNGEGRLVARYTQWWPEEMALTPGRRARA